MEQLAEREHRDQRLAAAIGELVARGPLPGQSGIVVTHGRRIFAAAIYGGNELLTAAWETLVRGYPLEARGEARGIPSASKALRFLKEVSQCVVAVNDAVGLGRGYRIASGKIAGQALTSNDKLGLASAIALAA